jgi:hypothetical protein
VKPDTTLEELSESIRGGAVPRNRLVVSIQGDGRDLLAQDLDEALRRPAIEYDRLDFLTEATSTVAVEALETAEQMFAESAAGRSQTANLFTQGHIDEALQLLGPCIGTWQRAFDAVAQVLTLTGLELDVVESDGVRLTEMVQAWTDQLRQIKEAFENKDFVLIADLLEYEFGPTTDRWSGYISCISETIQDKYSQVA